MFSITTSKTGLFQFVQRPNKDELLARAWSAALQKALAEYATGSLRGAKLANRFEAWAFGAYGFAARSRGYMKTQERYMGQVRPYFSPRPTNFTRLAQAVADLANGRGNTQALIREVARLSQNANRPHMRDLVTKPGGYRTRATGKRAVVVTMSYPGARVLNKLGSRGEQYRREFNDLARGGGRDLRAILTRAAQIYDGIVAGYLGSAA